MACAAVTALAVDVFFVDLSTEANVASLVVVAVSIVGYARLKRRYRLETLKAVVDAYAQREIRKETSRSPRWTNALRTLDGVYAGKFD